MKRALAAVIISFVMSSAAALYGANSQVLLEQGLEAFKSANYKNAELLFRKCMDEDDDNAEKAGFYLSRALCSQKKYKDAIFEFNRFLVNCRSLDLCIESRFWMGECWFGSSEFIKAIEEYKRFITQNRDKENPLVSLSHERIAEIYSRQQRYDEALIELRLALETVTRDERKSALNIRIAEVMFKNRKADEAEAVLAPLSSSKDPLVAAQANILLGRISGSRDKHRAALWYYSRIPDSMTSTYPYCEALYFRGMTYLALEDRESAKTFLQGFVNTGKASPWYLYARFQLAKLAEAQNQAESIAVMEEVRSSGPDRELSVELAVELERMYMLKGQPEKGIPFLEEVRSAADADRLKDLLYELGGAYLASNNFAAAETVYSQMLENYAYDNDVDRIQFQLAVVYLKKGDSSRAAKEFEKIAKLNVFSSYIGEANYYLAAARFDQNDYKGSLGFVDEYLKNQNGDKRYDACLLQLHALMRLADYAGAERSAGNILRRYSDHVGVDAVILDFIRFARAAKKDASNYENFVTRNFPDSDSAASVYLMRADADFSAGNWKRAEQSYTAYLRIKGNEANPGAFINKGICIYRQDNFAGVISYLSNEKLELFNSEYSSRVVILLAKANFYAGKIDKAYEYFNAAKDYVKEMEDLDCYFEAAIKNDNIGYAKELSSRLRGDKSRYYHSLYEIGLYYKDAFSYEDARGYFSRVFIDYPETQLSELALLELALLDIKDARYDEALSRLKGVKARSLDNRKTVITITAFYKTGRYAEGMELLRRNISAILKEPETKTLLKSTVEYLVSNDDAQSILGFSRYVAANFPDDMDHVNISVANIYFREKNYSKAFSYYSKIQGEGEYRTEVLYRMAVIQEQVYKNPRAAIQVFQQLADSKESDEYVSAGKIELALLYYEKGQKEQSRMMLSDIVGKKENIAAIIKASNILSYYSLETEAIQNGPKGAKDGVQ